MENSTFETIKKTESKLRTYAIFKTEIGSEKYLHEITNITERQSLTKFRLSNNNLDIEKGRHTTPKTPKDRRFCTFCSNKEEDKCIFYLNAQSTNPPEAK